MSLRPSPDRPRSTPAVVVALCFAMLVLEGYDLLMYGTVVPALLAYAPWGLDAAAAGRFGALTVIGMMVGALATGVLVDRFGRRRMLAVSVLLFSVSMIGCALAPTPGVFGAFRLLLGVGTGAFVPAAVAMLIEFSHPARRTWNTALGFAGLGVGGILAGGIGAFVIPAFGFRAMFWIGGLPVLVVLPLLLRFLPESATHLAARGRRAEAEAVAQRYGLSLPAPAGAAAGVDGSAVLRLRALFTGGRARGTVAFWIAVALALLVTIGVSTWLPTMMARSGFAMGSAVFFVLVLNVGAVAGSLVAAKVADRRGARGITIGSFVCGAGSIALLAAGPPTPVVYLLVALVGLGTTGTQTLLNAQIGSWYDGRLRGAGLGAALGFGRLGGIVGPLYGAAVVGGGLALGGQFLAFAVPALVGALVVAMVPRRVAEADPVDADPVSRAAEAP